MVSTKGKKLRAMKHSNCYKNIQLVIYNLIVSSLIALFCNFLCSYLFWFSTFTSSLNLFVSIYLPKICSTFLSPKCLFIVFNVIVMFLIISESKLLGKVTSMPSPVNDIYSEYVERARILHGANRFRDEKKVYEDKEAIVVLDHQHKEEKLHDDINIIEKLVIEEKEEEEVEEFKEAQDSEEAESEELNRRVEEFIARINKQRRIEALER